MLKSKVKKRAKATGNIYIISNRCLLLPLIHFAVDVWWARYTVSAGYKRPKLS